jgi:hypothetical protein
MSGASTPLRPIPQPSPSAKAASHNAIKAKEGFAMTQSWGRAIYWLTDDTSQEAFDEGRGDSVHEVAIKLLIISQ